MLDHAADDHAPEVYRDVATLHESPDRFQAHPIAGNINDTRLMITGLDVVQIPDKGILFYQVAWLCASVVHDLIMWSFRLLRHAVNVQESDDDVASILSEDGLVSTSSTTQVERPLETDGRRRADVAVLRFKLGERGASIGMISLSVFIT